MKKQKKRLKQFKDARVYNELITTWHEIMAVSLDSGHVGTQLSLELE